MGQSERAWALDLTEAETRAALPIARAFHEAYERLAPDYDYRTRRASAVPWDQVPLANRALMINVAWDLIANGVITTPKRRRRG